MAFKIFRQWRKNYWVAYHPAMGQTGYSIELTKNGYECFNEENESLAIEQSLAKAKKWFISNTGLGNIKYCIYE